MNKIIKLTRQHDGLDAWLFTDHITGMVREPRASGTHTRIFNYDSEPWDVVQTPLEIIKLLTTTNPEEQVI